MFSGLPAHMVIGGSGDGDGGDGDVSAATVASRTSATRRSWDACRRRRRGPSRCRRPARHSPSRGARGSGAAAAASSESSSRRNKKRDS